MSHRVQFSHVEEIEGAAQALGWRIEYRQMGKGEFKAEFTTLESEGIYLASQRFNNFLHVHCQPPDGFIGFFFTRFGGGHGMACGHRMKDGDLVVFPSQTELEFVTQGEIHNDILLMPETDFQDIARSIAPADHIYCKQFAAIQHGDPIESLALIDQVDAIHCKGGLDSENAAILITRMILWMAHSWSQTSADRLAHRSTAATARRAQTWIEAHLRKNIQLQDLCAAVGVGLRTLQRCFATHFQISPTNYIKARRLNLARRDLVAADPATNSVSKIAKQNGFCHLSRFSVDYRAHFGESPSETLATRHRNCK